MKRITLLILILLAFFLPKHSISQYVIPNSDLSNLTVDGLSDVDVETIKNRLKESNLSVEQWRPIAMSKGMNEVEFNKLKARLLSAAPVPKTVEQTTVRTQEIPENMKSVSDPKSLIFGSELFDNPNLNFEPNLKIASPVNYTLGPGDELQVSVYGVQEYDATVVVNVEGKVSIQNVGKISVSGLSFEAATSKIKNAIARVYSTVASQQSKVEVSISKIRTIKITLIGSKQPGNYSISSLATVYNALFLGGGPSENETYRNIELLRNNKVIQKIDLYNFLVGGDQSDNVGLKDNDVIRIPVYENRVTLEGQVKRAGIFEMKKGESFEDLINFASGFTDVAYKASVSVIQTTDKEFKVKDLPASEFKDYEPQSGDSFKVSKILDRFENRISIKGAVFRPGTYSLYDNMRLSDLISKADGLKEDAYTKRAALIRVNPDLTNQIINVDLANVMNGNIASDILLEKEDQITIYSALNFKEEYKITIDGEINSPGLYSYYENITLNDLFILAGGLSGAASKRVEIARMIKSDNVNDANLEKVELINLEITPSDNEQAENFILRPFDIINIRKMAQYEKPELVTVNGEVNYPGKYVLANKKDKIYDIIQRAGGLTNLANINGVKILRPISEKQKREIENINTGLGENDSAEEQTTDKLNGLRFTTIPIDWEEVQKNQKSNTNVTLLSGDLIEVNAYTEGVKVSGNVLLNSELPFEKGKSLRQYVNSVGGVDANGWLRKAYVIYPNGEAATSKSFMFLPFNPSVTPGSQIIIPQKPPTMKLNTFEIVSIGSIMTSLALLVITAFR